jgi:O-antigen/teichoic acid export membrane protein
MGADAQVIERRSLLWSAEVLRLGLGFAVLTVLTHSIAPVVLGTYLSVTALVLIVPRLLDCGLPHALGYFLRIEPAALQSSGRVLARHVLLAAPVALAFAFGLRFFPFANDEVVQITREHWWQLSLLMLSELGIVLGLSSFVPTGRFRSYLFTVVAPPALLLTAVALWPRLELGAGQLLNLLLCTSLVGFMIVIGSFARVRPEQRGAAFPTSEAYRFGVRSYGAAVCKFMAQRFDRLFLVTVLGAAGYAQYSLAVSIRDMAILPANLYAMTLRNHQIDLIAREQRIDAARTLLLRQSLVWLGLGLAGAAAMYPLWQPLVRWVFGAQFEGAGDFLKIIGFSGGPLAIMGYAWNHLYALQRPGRVTVLTAASLGLVIPVFLLLIHWRGPTEGVALAVVAWAALAALASLAWAWLSEPSRQALERSSTS